MEATINLNMDNAAFDGQPEIETARLLRQLADNIEIDGCSNQSIFDYNGNKVGSYRVTE